MKDSRLFGFAEAFSTTHTPNEIVTSRETYKIAAPIQWSSIFWATVGWSIADGMGGYMYDSFGEIIGGASGGMIGGLVTLFALRGAMALSSQKNMIWVALAWAIGGFVLSWQILKNPRLVFIDS